jgi:hypothetical protein
MKNGDGEKIAVVEREAEKPEELISPIRASNCDELMYLVLE